jgi:hypothetical protein
MTVPRRRHVGPDRHNAGNRKILGCTHKPWHASCLLDDEAASDSELRSIDVEPLGYGDLDAIGAGIIPRRAEVGPGDPRWSLGGRPPSYRQRHFAIGRPGRRRRCRHQEITTGGVRWKRTGRGCSAGSGGVGDSVGGVVSVPPRRMTRAIGCAPDVRGPTGRVTLANRRSITARSGRCVARLAAESEERGSLGGTRRLGLFPTAH